MNLLYKRVRAIKKPTQLELKTTSPRMLEAICKKPKEVGDGNT
jgi:hypothetical protein